jgi:hypothetical protein
MITKLAVYLIVMIPALARAQPATNDAADIVRKAVEQYAKNEETLRNYTYRDRTVIEDLDGKGRVKDTHSKVMEIMYVGGRQFTRTLEEDGKPVKQAEKKPGRTENAEMRAANNPFRRVPVAYDLKIVGQPQVNGRLTWEIHAAPKKDYTGPHASVFRNVEGTLWVDQKDNAWVQFEADTSDTISFGLFLARVAKGTRIHVERVRVNDEVWAPSVVSMQGSARLALVKSINQRQNSIFSEYKRYSTDSRLVGTDQ